MTIRYVGARKGMFKARGPLTRMLYRVPGQGQTFCADPSDIYGAKGRNGFLALPQYEEA